MTIEDGALVLLSGGQDSATCLAWALERYSLVETVGYDYGQRHRVELECREVIRKRFSNLKTSWGEHLGGDHTISLPALGEISSTALTRDVMIKMGEGGLPNTFIPGRNIIFLTFAAALAYRRGLRHIVTGVCETDYSGYPDCRDDTMKSLQVTLNLGMDQRFALQTPLMWIDKAATWQMAVELGGRPLVNCILEHTHTCYLGERSIRHTWGYGCGSCPACDLRADGYNRFVESVDADQRVASVEV